MKWVFAIDLWTVVPYSCSIPKMVRKILFAGNSQNWHWYDMHAHIVYKNADNVIMFEMLCTQQTIYR